jgi:para-aminobenzoate synthetase component I
MAAAPEVGWLALEPVEAAARLAGRRGRVLLHSGRDDDGCGRWSFVACEPEASLECRGREIALRDRDGGIAARWQGDPLAALDELVAAAGVSGEADGASEPPPLPLAIGYLGYDLGRVIERLPAGPSRGDDTPDLWFGRYGAVYRYDEARGRGEVVGRDPVAATRLRGLLSGMPDEQAPAPRFGPLLPDDDGAAYRRRVERILDYIHAGDVYQVNLARRLVAAVERDGDALALYRALTRAAPAPFGALLECDGLRVVSGSPERFLQRAPGGDRLETRPIKGTRRRAGDPVRDAAAAAELAADEKERAEHLMIVDLERNDLGRVAVTGSVIVDALGYVVELPALYHLVSTVSCRLRPGLGTGDILRATFPGGSITGAPKIRAMEIIDELEPARRGPYTGAFGYLGAAGAMDLAIAIRTAVWTGDELRLHVGGGIVADSTPEREMEETEEKAAGWRQALAAMA